MEATNNELVSHDIYASNLLIGRSLLFSLRLSPDWQLASGVGRPEVVAIQEYSGQKWVVSGDAWYVLYQNEKQWALELAIKIRTIPAAHKNVTGETVAVNTHPGYLSWKQKRRGLPWNRHTVTFMNVIFNCQNTERQINLEFSGWCPSEGFEEILQALKHLGCH